MQKILDLKQTANLPRTDFPMKANLPQTEPKLLERWERENLYEKIRRVRAGRPTYIQHDGPLIERRAQVDAPDCHGLPIEIKADQDLGARKSRMKPVEIRAACRRLAEKRRGVHQGKRHPGRVARLRLQPPGGATEENGLSRPADLYLEGGDQYRGWSHSSLPESAHLALCPQPEEQAGGIPEEKRARNWDRLMQVRQDNGDLYPLLQEYARELPALFIVSHVPVATRRGPRR